MSRLDQKESIDQVQLNRIDWKKRFMENG